MINGSLKSKYSPDSTKLFHIVIPTYGGGPKLEVIVNCFLAQTCQDYHISIVSDGPEPETAVQLEKYYDIENFSYYQLDKRYNDWGHTPREFGMYQSDCEFTLMSGYDNYYVPTFIHEFRRAARLADNVKFIYCNMAHNHVIRGSPYNGHIDSILKCGRIDIGNFATNTDLLKIVGYKSRAYAADWDLVESLIPYIFLPENNVVKIPQTLYVHN